MRLSAASRAVSIRMGTLFASARIDLAKSKPDSPGITAERPLHLTQPQKLLHTGLVADRHSCIDHRPPVIAPPGRPPRAIGVDPARLAATGEVVGGARSIVSVGTPVIVEQ